jgi:hypothetical protein
MNVIILYRSELLNVFVLNRFEKELIVFDLGLSKVLIILLFPSYIAILLRKLRSVVIVSFRRTELKLFNNEPCLETLNDLSQISCTC